MTAGRNLKGRAHVFGDIRNLPNQGSPHQTPATLLADWHYEKIGLLERWNWNRFARLCRFLNLTPYELASVVAMSHKAVDEYQREKRLSTRSHRAVALLLTILEAQVCAKYSEDIIPNPFPDLSNAGTITPPPA